MQTFAARWQPGQYALRHGYTGIPGLTWRRTLAKVAVGVRGRSFRVWRAWRRTDGAGDAEPLLSTRGLTKSFRRLVALKNHEITVRRGEIVGVIGPNGSGKSTFFNVVSGFQRADSGAIRFAGKPIERLSASPIVRLGIARTFQGSRLFARLSVAENVRAAAQLRHPTTMADAVLGTPRLRRNEAEVEAITRELLDLVDLTIARDDARQRAALRRPAPA